MLCRFVDEYYKEKWRGYGGNVTAVFSELQKENCAEPHVPATKQFDGQVLTGLVKLDFKNILDLKKYPFRDKTATSTPQV